MKKKILKTISYLSVICAMFAFNHNYVNAAEEVNFKSWKGECSTFDAYNYIDVATCNYSGGGTGSASTARIVLKYDKCVGNVKTDVYISQFKGNPVSDNRETDKNTSSSRQLEYSHVCPEALAIKKKSGYTVTSGTVEEVENVVSEDTKHTEKLTLVDTTKDQISKFIAIQAMNGYIAAKSESDEGYTCEYDNGKLKLGFSDSFHSRAGFSKYSFIENKNSKKCPSVVYKVEYNRISGYVLNESDWPNICVDDKEDENDNGVTCTKFSKDSKIDYTSEKKKDAKETISGLYYRQAAVGLDQNNVLSLNVIVERKNNKITYTPEIYINSDKKYKVYLADTSAATINDYVNSIAFYGGELPASLSCLHKKNIKKDYMIGLDETIGSDDEYYYCKLSSVVGTFTENATEEVYILSSSSVGGNGTLDINFTNDFINNFEAEYKAACDSNKYSKTCRKFQNNKYDTGKNILNSCKNIYANLSITETDVSYTTCQNFEKNFLKWAKDGYFGNNIITENSGNTCDQTLGSLGDWLTTIFKIMLLAVPVIIMVFGFKDFIKALLSGKDDELKKSGSNFIKRLIFGAVFVALPMIIKVILTIALGGNFADICIL